MNKKKKIRIILTIAAAAAVLVAAVMAGAVTDPSNFDEIPTIGSPSKCPHCGSSDVVHQFYGDPPTCTSPEYASFKCNTCGGYWKAILVDQLEHSMSASRVERAATCVAKGLRKSECTYRCGYVQTSDIPIDPDAHNMEQREGTDPTCETAGTKEYWECTLCHKIFADDGGVQEMTAQDLQIPAAGHTWSLSITPPTCTAPGFTTKTCSVCGTSGGMTDPTDITAHAMEKTDGTKETCTRPGIQDTYTCTVCHGVFLDEDGHERANAENTQIPASGHSLLRTVGAAPSCEQPGVREHWTCTQCGLTFADADGEGQVTDTSLPPSGHLLEHVSGKDAGCETEGSSEHWQCTQCGKFFSDESGETEISFKDTHVPAAGHRLEHFVEKTPGEDEDGWLEHWKCTVCGKLFGDESGSTEMRPADVFRVATGHMLEAVPEIPAQCTVDGTAAHYACSGCGALFEDAKGEHIATAQQLRIAAPGHREERTVTHPDCTNDGQTTYTCVVCSNVRADLVQSALGHDLVHVTEQPATETEKGQNAHWRCTRCGLLFQDGKGREPAGSLEIPPTGHSWEDTVIPPTCTEPGYTEHRCTGCGEETKDTEVPAAGHTMVHNPGKEATEDEPGVREHWMCTQCGKLFEDEDGKAELVDPAIPAKGHSYEDEIVPPTCTEPGYTQHTCSECGDVVRDSETPPAGHKTEHVPGQPETEDEDGLKEHWKCIVCGALFEDDAAETEIEDPSALIIPASGHAYEDTVFPANCVSGGYTEHVCKDCGRTYTDMETDPLGHILTRFPAQAPTLTSEGNIEYWKCERCGCYFEDAQGTREIAPESVVRARLEKDPGGGSVATGDTKDLYRNLIGAGAGLALVLFLLLAARRRASSSK